MPGIDRRHLLASGLGAASLGLLSPTRSFAAQTVTQVPPPAPESPDRRLIFTYYYYWYDSVTGGHLAEGSGLRYHLPPSPTPTWRSTDWHKKQLLDVADAGIDVALPVYWGFQKPDDNWSWEGLPVLAQARQELQSQGKNVPSIGMFFDTTIVAGRDLTATANKAWFYANIKDFFSRVPSEHWALINGKPVVFLFTSDWTAAMNQSTFDLVYSRFKTDFGVRPYIVRETSWNYPILRWQDGQRVWDYAHPIRTENSYLWGAAQLGYRDHPGGVASVGPGYDDHLIPGRGSGWIVDRLSGDFYQWNFLAAIGSNKPLLTIETWNEIHEGSSICDTVETGRQYIDLTKPLAAAFHSWR